MKRAALVDLLRGLSRSVGRLVAGMRRPDGPRGRRRRPAAAAVPRPAARRPGVRRNPYTPADLLDVAFGVCGAVGPCRRDLGRAMKLVLQILAAIAAIWLLGHFFDLDGRALEPRHDSPRSVTITIVPPTATDTP